METRRPRMSLGLLLLMLVYGFVEYSFASDAAIVMTENPSRLYMVHLSSPAPRVELLAVNTTGSRPIWNNITNEIMWGEGSNIIKMSIDGGGRKLTSINVGLNIQIRDLALDTLTGDIYFAEDRNIGVVKSKGQIVYPFIKEMISIDGLALDPKAREIYYCFNMERTGIWKRSLDGTNRWPIVFYQSCKGLAFNDGKFFWITPERNTQKLYSGRLTWIYDCEELYTFKDPAGDLSVYGDYVYVVGKLNTNLLKINKKDSTDVTKYNIGLKNMAFVEVFQIPGTE